MILYILPAVAVAQYISTDALFSQILQTPFVKPILYLNGNDLVILGGDFLMSGICVCATNQGRFFTSKNPEQASNFLSLTPEQALLFDVLLQNRILF